MIKYKHGVLDTGQTNRQTDQVSGVSRGLFIFKETNHLRSLYADNLRCPRKKQKTSKLVMTVSE